MRLRRGELEEERDVPSIHRISAQMATVDGIGPGWSQKPGASSIVSGAESEYPAIFVFSGTSTGRWKSNIQASNLHSWDADIVVDGGLAHFATVPASVSLLVCNTKLIIVLAL